MLTRGLWQCGRRRKVRKRGYHRLSRRSPTATVLGAKGAPGLLSPMHDDVSQIVDALGAVDGMKAVARHLLKTEARRLGLD